MRTGRSGRRPRVVCGLLLLGLLAAAPAASQTGPALRPAEAKPPESLPTDEAPPPRPPPLAPLERATPSPDEGSADAAGLRIEPRAFQIDGCTAFDAETVRAWLDPYRGHPLGTLEILELVDVVREHYHAAGFATTEAFLPDQDFRDGRLRIVVVEGRLEGIEIGETRFHRAGFLEARLAAAAGTPLHVPQLVNALEAIQGEPAIERVAARLVEVGPARHRLEVRLEERPPWRVLASSSNHRSPSVGSVEGRLEFMHLSLLGLGDRLRIGGALSEGVRDAYVDWNGPITPWDTRLLLAWRQGRARIVEGDFETIDIEGRFQSVSVGLRQTVHRAAGREVAVEVLGEWRRSASSILDRIECFQADLDDCTPTAAILRLRSDLTWRKPRRGLALRSTLSFGLDALGATEETRARQPDGEFTSWLLQLEWAQRVPPVRSARWLEGAMWLLRGDLQLASDPLLSFEQIAIGGPRTVRGYRQNQIVRDNGASASLEFRLPVLRSAFDRPVVEVAPFVDYGSAWDRRRSDSPDETLVSLGLALRLSPTEAFRAELSWAHRLRQDLQRGDRLQRNGIYFEVVWSVFDGS